MGFSFVRVLFAIKSAHVTGAQSSRESTMIVMMTTPITAPKNAPNIEPTRFRESHGNNSPPATPDKAPMTAMGIIQGKIPVTAKKYAFPNSRIRQLLVTQPVHQDIKAVESRQRKDAAGDGSDDDF
jgi:hypothetical protein